MGIQDASDTVANPRQQLSFILTVVGVFDLALGTAIAVFGPGVIGDPSLDSVIRIAGAVVASGGLGILWFARKRRRADTSSDRGAVQRDP